MTHRNPLAIVLLLTFLLDVRAKDLCDFEDAIKSCECYFDGQHFAVQCTRTDLAALPSTKVIPHDAELLDVSHNRIRQLQLDDAGFECKLLRVFRAAHNSIETLSARFLASVPHLNTLDLSHNRLAQVEAGAFAHVASLHSLDLSYNRIHLLPDAAFVRVRNLRLLDVSYNPLGAQLSQHKSLRGSGLGFGEDMRTLRLNAVNLTAVPSEYFRNMSLTVLSLADNGIADVPLLPTTLITLDLSGNAFETIAPRHLVYAQLKELRLNRLKRLTAFDNYAFYNLLSLEVLEVQHCPLLKSFNDKAFGVILEKEAWNLRRISLSGNALRRLNQTYFSMFNALAEVDLSDNPWICDCEVMWFKLVRPKLANRENMRCVAPRSLRNRPVLDLSDDTLPKCNVQSSIRVQKVLTSVICILVVVLLGVIMYLIYLAPYKGNRAGRYLGEQSPYNSMHVQDDSAYLGDL